MIDLESMGNVAGAGAREISKALGASSGLAALIGEIVAAVPRFASRAADGDLIAKTRIIEILGEESRSTVERAADSEALRKKFGPEE